MKHNGECNLSIVENVINQLSNAKLILISLFVQLFYLEQLINIIVFMPEFLTEKNYLMILLIVKIG